MLYWQKAVVFMLNPKKYTTHAGHNSIVVWLLGPSSCSSPSTKELHVHFIGEWWCTFLLFSLFLTFFSLATVSLSLFPSLSTTHTDTYTRRVASRRVTSRRVTSRHVTSRHVTSPIPIMVTNAFSVFIHFSEVAKKEKSFAHPLPGKKCSYHLKQKCDLWRSSEPVWKNIVHNNRYNGYDANTTT